MLNPLILLMVFLLAGFVLREVITPLKKLYIPASMIGGIIALILGPQVLGLIQIPDSWSSLASPMVNIVIACMIFGITIKRGAFKGLGGTIVSTFFIYCAQVAVGSLVGFGLSKVWTSLPEQWGVMPVFCFYGGHGGGVTAGDAFASVGIENMTDMGIVLSTIGLLVALTVGMFWVSRSSAGRVCSRLPRRACGCRPRSWSGRSSRSRICGNSLCRRSPQTRRTRP